MRNVLVTGATGFIEVECDLALAPTYPSIHEGNPAVLAGHVQHRWRHPILDRRTLRATPLIGDGGKETSA